MRFCFYQILHRGRVTRCIQVSNVNEINRVLNRKLWSQVAWDIQFSLFSPHPSVSWDAKSQNWPRVTRFEGLKRWGEVAGFKPPGHPDRMDHQMQFILKSHYRKIAERHLCVSHGRQAGVGQGGLAQRQTDWKTNLSSERVCHRSNLRWGGNCGDG